MPIIASTSQLLVTNPSFPVKNVRELIALCKARPGEVNYGSSGAGGSLHLAMELFKSTAGIDDTSSKGRVGHSHLKSIHKVVLSSFGKPR